MGKHEGSTAYKQAWKKKLNEATKAIQSNLTGGAKGSFTFAVSASIEEQKYAQARWYIYGKHVVSKDTFTDEAFVAMVKAQNCNAKIITENELKQAAQRSVPGVAAAAPRESKQASELTWKPGQLCGQSCPGAGASLYLGRKKS